MGDQGSENRGDGLVERADGEACGVEDVKSVGVLHVCAVTPGLRPLLAVLYDWGEAEWSYRLTDPDHDGIMNLLEYAFGLNPTLTNDEYWKADVDRTGGP